MGGPWAMRTGGASTREVDPWRNDGLDHGYAAPLSHLELDPPHAQHCSPLSKPRPSSRPPQPWMADSRASQRIVAVAPGLPKGQTGSPGADVHENRCSRHSSLRQVRVCRPWLRGPSGGSGFSGGAALRAPISRIVAAGVVRCEGSASAIYGLGGRLAARQTRRMGVVNTGCNKRSRVGMSTSSVVAWVDLPIRNRFPASPLDQSLGCFATPGVLLGRWLDRQRRRDRASQS